MAYKVARIEKNRMFPNGTFGTKAEAERHADKVAEFHGCRPADVAIEHVPEAGDMHGLEPDDEAG